MTEPPGEPLHVEIGARAAVWRVFGVARDYGDRQAEGPSWSQTIEVGPAKGDLLTVTIGELPSNLIESLRVGHALGRYMLLSMFGGEYKEKSAAEIELLLDEWAAGATEVEDRVRGGRTMWLTLEQARPLRLKADPDARHRWLRDDAIDPDFIESYSAEAGDFLDLVVARSLSVLGTHVPIARPTHSKRTTYFLATGKAPLSMPNLEMKLGGASVMSEGWTDLPLDDLVQALEPLTKPQPGLKLVQSPTRWLQAAMSEVDDPLRQFMFAFFGLEVLANKVGKKVEGAVVSELSSELTLPVKHLFWPAPPDGDSPWRNLTFRFSIVAIRLSRTTAEKDVEEFKFLAGQRNKLSHGSATEDDLPDLPGPRAVDLLLRYIGLVAAADAAGEL